MAVTMASTVTSPWKIKAGFRPFSVPLSLGSNSAHRTGVGAAVLIVTLIWHHERIRGSETSREIGEQAASAFESSHSLQAELRIETLLHVLEVCEGVVFHGVKIDQVGFGVVLRPRPGSSRVTL